MKVLSEARHNIATYLVPTYSQNNPFMLKTLLQNSLYIWILGHAEFCPAFCVVTNLEKTVY